MDRKEAGALIPPIVKIIHTELLITEDEEKQPPTPCDDTKERQARDLPRLPTDLYDVSRALGASL